MFLQKYSTLVTFAYKYFYMSEKCNLPFNPKDLLVFLSKQNQVKEPTCYYPQF